MQPSLDPVQFSALFGAAVVQALAAVALFSSLQLGPALKVYFSGSLVEVGAVVGFVVVEVELVVQIVVVEQYLLADLKNLVALVVQWTSYFKYSLYPTCCH
jgi:hypothetical protein